MISIARISTTVHHHYHHQQVLILAIALWACSCRPHLSCMHRKQYNHWCYIYCDLLYNQMRTHTASSPRQQLGQTGFPLAQSWASSRIRRAPNHASGNRFWGTVPSIDAFQCVACRWARFTFSINASVIGGRLHNFKAAPIWVFLLHILIRASLMLAHLLNPLPYQLNQYEWRSLLEYNSFICLCIYNSM